MAVSNTSPAPRTVDRPEGRTASKEVRRRQLIEATIEAIAQHGIAGTTMTVITGLAGLSLGIVNFHFQNKENLLEETLRYLAVEHRNEWRRALDNAPDRAADQLVALVDAQYNPSFYSRKKLAVWFAFYGEVAYRAAYRKIMSEMDGERWVLMCDLCQEIIEDGNYANVDGEHIASTLEGLFDGFSLNILIYPDEFRPVDAAMRIREFLARTFPDHITHPAGKEAAG